MDVCEEGIAIAALLEEHLLKQVPIPFEGVRMMREAQHDLASRSLGAIDNAVMHIESQAHTMRTRMRLQGGPGYDEALGLLERVQAWERRVTEATELNGV